MAALTIFVPGRLGNPMNGSHGHWSTRAKWAKAWRGRTHVLTMNARTLSSGEEWMYLPAMPKRIRFRARTWNPVDDDALPAMCKPCRDGLRDAGLIDDDGPRSGHQFVYAQCIDRKRRGVEITVEPLELTVRHSDCTSEESA